MTTASVIERAAEIRNATRDLVEKTSVAGAAAHFGPFSGDSIDAHDSKLRIPIALREIDRKLASFLQSDGPQRIIDAADPARALKDEVQKWIGGLLHIYGDPLTTTQQLMAIDGHAQRIETQLPGTMSRGAVQSRQAGSLHVVLSHFTDLTCEDSKGPIAIAAEKLRCLKSDFSSSLDAIADQAELLKGMILNRLGICIEHTALHHGEPGCLQALKRHSDYVWSSTVGAIKGALALDIWGPGGHSAGVNPLEWNQAGGRGREGLKKYLEDRHKLAEYVKDPEAYEAAQEQRALLRRL